MRYLRAGSGPPLVLVHGLLGYSFSWRFAMPVLAQSAAVFAVDQVGAGYSDRPVDLDCSFSASANRLLRFLDQAGIASCDLLGTSHGGAVAMIAASLAPERVKRLILVAPVNPWSPRGKLLAPLIGNGAIAPLLLHSAPLLEICNKVVLRRMYGDPRRIAPGTMDGYSAPLRLPNALRYPLGVLRNWSRGLGELRQAFPGIREIPTLLVWGTFDTAVHPTSCTCLRQEFSRCRLVMMEGIGHLPYEEVPEDFNRIVIEFLNAKRIP
ncbi:MAG TPA: alpha/beta hydrolase [Terriglobales bacterium]|nr:alpha/beta hydrolase [Terriglobales bacterium]